MNLPAPIRRITGDRPFTVDKTGMSKARILCFDDMVLKIQPQDASAQKECCMMQWLSGKLPVPRVIACHEEQGTQYLLMSRIPGEMACAPAFLQAPEALVDRLAEGLHMLWAVELTGCPCNSSLDEKLKLAQFRVSHGLCHMDDAEPGTYGEHGFRSPEHLLKWLSDNRPAEDTVFSHGDYCLPNLLLSGGRISGWVDLGRSGPADRYQDIALCCRSLEHNLSGVYSSQQYAGVSPSLLFERLHIKPDWEKVRYYILLDELF